MASVAFAAKAKERMAAKTVETINQKFYLLMSDLLLILQTRNYFLHKKN